MRSFKSYLAIVLALCVLATGHAAAASRGASVGVEQVVLCTGAGPVAVYLDAEGTPTAPPHFCPDCVLHLLSYAQATEAECAHAAALRPVGFYGTGNIPARVHRAQDLRARAPPFAGDFP